VVPLDDFASLVISLPSLIRERSAVFAAHHGIAGSQFAHGADPW
jgi:hypothetical protein